MINNDLKYYILFENYTHGMCLHDELKDCGIKNRIAPAPREIQGDLSCGMSLLILPDDIETAKKYIEEHNSTYHSIVPLKDQIKSKRDKYC